MAADHAAKSIAKSTIRIQDLRTATNWGLTRLLSAATKATVTTTVTRASGMTEIHQFLTHAQSQLPQLHILPASAPPLAPQASQEHLLQTSRNSYHVSTRLESKTIYQTDSLAWPRCFYRRYQLTSKLPSLLYLCSADYFYLTYLFSPPFYSFFVVFFFLSLPYVCCGNFWSRIGARCKVNGKSRERRTKTEAHSLWLHDL